jgi:Flp pilus assembly protein TadG
MMSIASIARGVAATLNALRADRRGSVAWLMAGAIVPLVAAIGLSVDGARGWLVKSRLSQAIDAAGLAGGRVISSDSRDADIQMFFNANFPPNFMQAEVDGPHISVDPDETTITINARATIPTTFMRVVGINELTVSANTVVERMDRGMELALVIDNTGSMYQMSAGVRKIDAVKDAAKILVNALYGSRETVPNLWVSVVPYVATVNIGTNHVAWTVPRATSSDVVTLARTSVSGSPATSTVCATVVSNGTHSFHDGQIIDISGAVVSSSTANAYNGRVLIRTSNTTGCSITTATQRTQKFWYVIQDASLGTPTGTITAATPPIDYSRGGSWSGCVEARPSPYEEASAQALPDAGIPDTLWARYYWPSTRGVVFYNTNKKPFSSAIPAGPMYTPPSSSPTSYPTARYGDNDWGSPGYNGKPGMSPAVTDNPAVTDPVVADYFSYGPNFGCGRPIVPLQQSKSTVIGSINQMRPYGRSGTMANLGLAWGWRVLSPTWRGRWTGSPANMPLDYNTPLMSKVVVLLTDGKNEWFDYPSVLPGCGSSPQLANCVGANGHPNDGDYTAYGRLAERRLGAGINTIPLATDELDVRMGNLCTALKATGIILYTIVLETANTGLYTNCATSPAHAHFAASADQLAGIFEKISDQLANLRLAQ